MTIEMNSTRAKTMRKVLRDRPLLASLKEEDREQLVNLYMKNLEAWENRKNG